MDEAGSAMTSPNSSHMTTQELHPGFAVVIHQRMLDELEQCFHPPHFFEAVKQLHSDLPRAHRPHTFWQRRNPFRLRDVYIGRFVGFELTFTYVQTGNVLHVLHLGRCEECGDRRRPVDAVIGVRCETNPSPSA